MASGLVDVLQPERKNMKTRQLLIVSALCAAVSFHASAGSTEPVAQPEQYAPAASPPAAPMTPEEMQQRMQDMRRQHMEAMRAAPGSMPMMGQRGPMMPPEMAQQMRELRQQHMQMMGPGRGMAMDPEMMQQMQEMRAQRMQMMQAQAAEPVPAEGAPVEGASDTAPVAEMPITAAAEEPTGMPRPCGRMHAGMGQKCGGMQGGPGQKCGGMPQDQGMKQQMREMRLQHMAAMVQHMQNIENLLREMLELQKAR